jgi:hypothetical protein
VSAPSNDREAVTLILQGLLDVGVTIRGGNNGEDAERFTTLQAAVDYVFEVDECDIYVTLPKPDPETGVTRTHLFFVLGNEPIEVLCDHGVSLSEYVDPIVTPWWS